MSNKSIIVNLASQKAIKVLEHCAKKTGFYASGLPGGYEATWARDSMITGLGASTINDKFKIPFQKSIELLSKNQSRHGQIPNAVGSWNTERRSDVTFNSIDSTLWYLIGHQTYATNYKDKSLLKKYRQNINSAFTWLEYQDPNEDTLLVQQPTMDWEDAFPHKYGRVINTEALYFWALTLYGKNKQAAHLKKVVNGEIKKYLSLYDTKLGYYRPWVWKTHSPKTRESEEWFDTLGNLLAIVSGLATPKIAKNILQYIEKNKINRPFPCKSIYPPIIKPKGNTSRVKASATAWHSYFDECEAREPYHYLNGGIWPMIGGFYVAALAKAGDSRKATKELELLAKANQQTSNDWKKIAAIKKSQFGFAEWLGGKTGKVTGSASPFQAWSAGAYLYAHNFCQNLQ